MFHLQARERPASDTGDSVADSILGVEEIATETKERPAEVLHGVPYVQHLLAPVARQVDAERKGARSQETTHKPASARDMECRQDKAKGVDGHMCATTNNSLAVESHEEGGRLDCDNGVVAHIRHAQGGVDVRANGQELVVRIQVTHIFVETRGF